MNVPHHPSYPNPTIVEAVCDIRYEPVPGRAWKASLPGELFKEIQGTYPEMEFGLETALEFQFGPGGITQRMMPGKQRARFKHAREPVLLQFAENLLAVSVLPKYSGWAGMRSVILEVWSQAKPILGPAKIVRLGLRYINRIEREFPDQKPSVWLRATRYVAPAVLSSAPGFLSRVESRSEGDLVIVTLGEAEAGAGSGAPLVFDIDSISERSLSPEDGTLSAEIDRLHENVWNIFSEAKTEKLDALLNRREG